MYHYNSRKQHQTNAAKQWMFTSYQRCEFILQNKINAHCIIITRQHQNRPRHSEILQNVYWTCITDLDNIKHPLRMESKAKLDNAVAVADNLSVVQSSLSMHQEQWLTFWTLFDLNIVIRLFAIVDDMNSYMLIGLSVVLHLLHFDLVEFFDCVCMQSSYAPFYIDPVKAQEVCAVLTIWL